MVFQFVTTPVSVYFSDLVLNIKKQLVNLDNHVQATSDSCSNEKTRGNLIETNKVVNDLYYLDDVIRIGDSPLSKLVVSNLVSLVVFPMLISLLQLGQSEGAFLSGLTLLVVIAWLLQIVQEEKLVNFVASAIRFADVSFSMENATEQVTNGGASYDVGYPESNHADHLKRNCLLEHLSGYFSSDSFFASSGCEDLLEERTGMMSHILSDNKPIMLASFMLLLVVAESKGLHCQLAGLMGLLQTKTNITKILHELLMVLASQPPYCELMQWQTGWFLRKVLIFQGYNLDREDVQMSCEQSCERLRRELGGCWFDHIPDTLKKEWESCKIVLEESSQSKDPLFAFELRHHQHTSCSNTHNGGIPSTMDWQRMVDTVKVFVLHLRLKAFIFNSGSSENLILNLKSNSLDVSDLRSASFGSEVSLTSCIPCKIAFTKVGTRDIYIAPVAMGTSGKLLLLEKHPLHSRRGLVIAIAPLVVLNPKIDENHPTWLCLQIRELEPRFGETKTKRHSLKTLNHEQDGRWTLGFADAKACDDARLVIVEEMNKHCSFVES